MPRKVFKILVLWAVFNLCFVLSVEIALGQCGPDGTRPCPKTSPVQVKKKTPAAAANSAKLRAERAERRRAEIARQKRKQLEKQNAKNPPSWLKNVIEYAKTAKTGRALELFPVADVTLGKTGAKLLSLTGENCGITGADGKLTHCYVVGGITFYCDENGLSDSLYLNRLRLGALPENWRRTGFDWQLSYSGWVDLFKKMGYESLATRKPTVVTQSGKKFLKAELMTVVNTTAGGRAQIILDFNFGLGKTTVDDPGTLFSIVIDKFN